MLKKIICSIFLLLLTGCTTYIAKDDSIILSIDEINIHNEVNISSIESEVNGIVLFDEYGRPDIDNTNTIIGAHSGYGYNAYFNNLSKLEKEDVISLYYNEVEYIYLIEDVFEVSEDDIEILENKEYSALTLITCNIKDTTKRIVVISKMIT